MITKFVDGIYKHLEWDIEENGEIVTDDDILVCPHCGKKQGQVEPESYCQENVEEVCFHCGKNYTWYSEVLIETRTTTRKKD